MTVSVQPATSAATHGSQAVVAAVTARATARSAVIWSLVFAAYLATSALGYADTYKTAAQRASLVRTFGSNAGVNALIGPARHIDTVAGFTAWRSLGVLGLVGAVWGLLRSTALLRGEEDAGRWELLLAGHTTRRAAVVQALLGLGAGATVLFVVPAVVLIVVGRSSKVGFSAAAAAFDVLVVVSSAIAFLAVGALTSQFAPTRRRAATYAGCALGAAYALRMVADSETGLEWLRWLTPLGWIEEAQPLTSPRPAALIPMGLFVAVVCGVAVWLAGRRDLGASTIPDRPTAVARTRLLATSTGLTVRLAGPSLRGWTAGIALGALMTGLIAKTAGQAMEEASGFQRALARLGAHGVGARAYLGVVFLILALLVSLVAAAQMTAARDEEAEGRLEHLLVRPVTRTRWLVGRLVVAITGIVTSGIVAGLFAWLGVTSQDGRVGLVRLLAAGLNLAPAALVVLGAGTLALGLRPRAVATTVYGVLAWSFLIEMIGSLVQANRWLLDTSVFHHTAAAPATDPAVGSDLVMLAIAVIAAAVGVAAFARRDMTGA